MASQNDQKKLDQTWKYRIKRWRRDLRARLSLWAARRYGTVHAKPGELPQNPERILVCRLNKRLGNVIFLTPLLASLAASFPKAKIDVLLLDPQHANLLRGLPGVDQVWVPPPKSGLYPLRFISLIRSMRQRRYDLAIDPNAMSVSNRIGILLSGAKKRLGFASGDQWLRLDYSAPFPKNIRHQALQALALFKNGLIRFTPTLVEQYQIAPSALARRAAERYWRDAFKDGLPSGPVVGFFIQATGAKQLPLDWWRDWLAALQAQPNTPTLVQLLPPGETPALTPELASLRISALDELAATLAHLDAFVAADSGPMHLAAAAGVPTLGLFRATAAESYRPLVQGCLTLQGQQLTSANAVEHVTGMCDRSRSSAK